MKIKVSDKLTRKDILVVEIEAGKQIKRITGYTRAEINEVLKKYR